MRINGLRKLSLLDFPEKTAAVVFTGGCNLRCPFCHNASLVLNPGAGESITEDEFFDFLSKRRGKLDGVCVTGGEPLMQEGLEDFIRRIRDMGFLVKLDTNGTFPDRLRRLIDEKLLDYAAMDIKNAPSRYAFTVGAPVLDISPILESAALLKEGRVPYEFRTTLVKGLHRLEDMEELGEFVRGADKYFLQNFKDSGDLVGFPSDAPLTEMASFSEEELQKASEILTPYVGHLQIRG